MVNQRDDLEEKRTRALQAYAEAVRGRVEARRALDAAANLDRYTWSAFEAALKALLAAERARAD